MIDGGGLRAIQLNRASHQFAKFSFWSDGAVYLTSHDPGWPHAIGPTCSRTHRGPYRPGYSPGSSRGPFTSQECSHTPRVSTLLDSAPLDSLFLLCHARNVPKFAFRRTHGVFSGYFRPVKFRPQRETKRRRQVGGRVTKHYELERRRNSPVNCKRWLKGNASNYWHNSHWPGNSAV